MRNTSINAVVIEGPSPGKRAECEPILRALPDWFGIESAIQHLAHTSTQLPTFVARADQVAVGFLTVQQHNAYSAELYVLGVLPAYHRRGIGRRLVAQAEAYLVGRSVEFVQVKTLGPSHPSPDYARTRAFYMALGYRPLEELMTFWSADNPCLILIKHLPSSFVQLI